MDIRKIAQVIAVVAAAATGFAEVFPIPWLTQTAVILSLLLHLKPSEK